jgi:type IV pilus assembly protein PilC
MNSGIDIRSLKKNSVLREEKTPTPIRQNRLWNILNRDIRFGAGLPEKIKESFYLELSSLLEAGIDIRTSLELIAENQEKNKYRLIFHNILQWVISGSTFSAALKKAQKFSVYEYFSVQIGEETGKLIQVLKELSIFFKKKIKQKRQIIGALTYPSIVLLVAFVAISFMITYVVPMFSDVFKRFGGDLPLPTKIVVGLSNSVKKWGGLFLLVAVSFIVIAMSQRKKEWFRAFISYLLLKIPVIRTLLSKIYLSRFAGTMALLIASKIPILQAIQMCRQMIGFYPIELSLYKVEEKIMAGTALYKGLGEHSIYPRKMVAMLKVGEDVNQLDQFFSKISEQYAEDVEYQTNILSKFIEPLIIVVLGLVVGVILIAMYLPLFKLGQAF